MGLHLYRKIAALVSAFIMAAAFVPVAFAGEAGASDAAAEDIDNIYENTEEYVRSLAERDGWSAEGSAWAVVGLARAGKLSGAQAKAYRDNVLALCRKNRSAKLSEGEVSENSRAILALTSAGYDPADVGGWDLLEPLSDLAEIRRQGINGVVWALIALDSGSYEVPEPEGGGVQTTRENLIASIIAAQHGDGGWSFSGPSDVDMTCMAVQALAPYYDREAAAADRALNWLSSAQHEGGGPDGYPDGSFSSGGSPTSESASQVIIALTAIGADPAGDGRFLKNGRGAMDSLLDFYVKGGGFKHVFANRRANTIATLQGYNALVASYRYAKGQNSLYDMSDRELRHATDADYTGDEAGEASSSPGTEAKAVRSSGAARSLTRPLKLKSGEGASPAEDRAGEAGNEDGVPPAKYGGGSKKGGLLPWIAIAAGAIVAAACLILIRRRLS